MHSKSVYIDLKMDTATYGIVVLGCCLSNPVLSARTKNRYFFMRIQLAGFGPLPRLRHRAFYPLCIATKLISFFSPPPSGNFRRIGYI